LERLTGELFSKMAKCASPLLGEIWKPSIVVLIQPNGIIAVGGGFHRGLPLEKVFVTVELVHTTFL
jgi:hypothetical protein